MRKKTENKKLWRVEALHTPKSTNEAGARALAKKLESKLNGLANEGYTIVPAIKVNDTVILVVGQHHEDPEPQVVVFGPAGISNEEEQVFQPPKLENDKSLEILRGVLNNISDVAPEEEKSRMVNDIINRIVPRISAEDIRVLIRDFETLITEHKNHPLHQRASEEEVEKCFTVQMVKLVHNLLSDRLRFQVQ